MSESIAYSEPQRETSVSSSCDTSMLKNVPAPRRFVALVVNHYEASFRFKMFIQPSCEFNLNRFTSVCTKSRLADATLIQYWSGTDFWQFDNTGP